MSRHRPSRFARPLVAALALVSHLAALAAPAGAASYTWTNPAGGSTGTPGNWNPVGTPGAGDTEHFTLAGSYDVSIPATSPAAYEQDLTSGTIGLTTTAQFTDTWFLYVQNNTTLVTNGAPFYANALEVDSGNSSWASLTLAPSAGLPSYPSHLYVTNAALLPTIAQSGKAYLNILGGSQLTAATQFDLCTGTAARCTLTVAGLVPGVGLGSRLSVGTPSLTNRFGDGGQAVVNVLSGGTLELNGPTTFGGQGTGMLWMYVNGTSANANATFNYPVCIGGDFDAAGPGGTSNVVIGDRGYLTANDLLQVGDVHGGGTSGLSSAPGAHIVMHKGLTVRTNGSFNVSGGDAILDGGALALPASGGLGIGGGDAGRLWLDNHVANGYVNNTLGGLFVGLGSGGNLRVSGAGTTFGTLAGTPVYTSPGTGNTCSLVVDSLALFEASGELGIQGGGLFGYGTSNLVVDGGGVVRAAHLTLGGAAFGTGPSGTATATVSGAGSSLTYGTAALVGGGTPGSTGPAVMTADSGGTIAGGIAPGALLVVQSPAGLLVAAHGGSAAADSMRLLGTARLDGGRFSVGLVNVSDSGLLGGHGLVTGDVIDAGTLTGRTATLPRGALRIGGTLAQATGSHVALALGSMDGAGNDSIVVDGAAALDGALDLTTDPDFHAAAGDSFTLAVYGSHSGSFASFTVDGAPGATRFDLVYRPDRLVAIQRASSTAVADAARVMRFALNGNATPRPELVLELPTAARASVSLYDVGGRRAASLHEGMLAAGRSTFAVDAAHVGLGPGVYFARALVEGRLLGTRTLVLLR